MTASRKPPRGAGRTAKPDSLRVAHEQITRNNGTLADIANLIEMEGKAVPSRRQPAQSSRSQAETGGSSATAKAKAVEKSEPVPLLMQPVFGIPVFAVLGCALILGAAVGVPLGVVTYGTALYAAVVDGLAIF